MGAGRGSAPNILPLQMQEEPVDVVWDAATHCSPTIANTGTGRPELILGRWLGGCPWINAGC